MELIILGSGTGIPLPDRGTPSLAVIVNDVPIILDMGPGALDRIAQAGIDFEKTRKIFLTHFHPDHTADLIHFLFASRIPPIMKRRTPFTISGPVGLGNLIRHLQDAYSDWLTPQPGLMTVEEFETGKTIRKDYEGFRLITAPIYHIPNSLAYRIEEPQSGKSLVYSGDTGPCDGIVGLAKEADLLVLECSFPDGQGMEGHLTPSQAGQIASMADVKQLVLTHFYPEVLKTDIEGQCRKTFQGKLILAEDLMRLQV